MRVRTIAAAAAIGALALAGCGGGGSDDSTRQEIVDSMVSEGATEEQANCFVDELGDDAQRLYEMEDDEATEEDMTQVIEAMSECVDIADLMNDELMTDDTAG